MLVYPRPFYIHTLIQQLRFGFPRNASANAWSQQAHACMLSHLQQTMFFICMRAIGLIQRFSSLQRQRECRGLGISCVFWPTSWTGPHARTHTAHPSPKPPRWPNTRCVRAHPPADAPHPPLPHGVLVACVQPCTRLDDHTPRTAISPIHVCLAHAPQRFLLLSALGHPPISLPSEVHRGWPNNP